MGHKTNRKGLNPRGREKLPRLEGTSRGMHKSIQTALYTCLKSSKNKFNKYKKYAINYLDTCVMKSLLIRVIVFKLSFFSLAELGGI